MTSTSITVAGVTITDIATYRAQLVAACARLKHLYAGFDPARPDTLLEREAEIVDLANNAERLREIVETWDAVDEKRANILAIYELVRPFEDDKP